MSFKNDNDYSVTFVFINGDKKRFVKWKYVHNLYKASQDVIKREGKYNYANVYNRRSKAFIMRIEPDKYIPPKPQ